MLSAAQVFGALRADTDKQLLCTFRRADDELLEVHQETEMLVQNCHYRS